MDNLTQQKIEFIRTMSRWETTRDDRVKMEESFRRFSGRADLVESHIPYTRWDIVFNAMELTSKSKAKSKILMLPGDCVNLDMFSRFHGKSLDKSLPSDEIDTLIKFLKIAEKVYDKIIYLTTNHDRRLEKVLFQYMPNDVASEFLKQVKTLKEYFDENKLKKIVYVPTHIFQIGDALVTHFESNSGSSGKVGRDLVQYLIPRIKKPWNIVFQGHTHHQIKQAIDRKVVVEIGGALDSLDYWRDGKLHGKGKLSSLGTGLLVMNNGVADLNQSGFVIQDWEGWL